MSKLRFPLGAAFAPELAKLSGIAAPLAVSYVIESIMSFTDAIVVGRLGSAELGGFGIASRVATDVGYIVCICVVGLVGIFAAQASAEARGDKLQKSLRHALWLSVLLSLPVMALLFSIESVLLFFGQSAETAKIAAAYGKGIAWAMVPYAGFSVLRDFSAAASSIRSVVVVIALASIGNLGLSILLVHGIGVLPGLGVFGAGLATSIVTWGMFLAELSIVIRGDRLGGLGLFRNILSVELGWILRYLSLGWPLAANSLAQTALWIALQLLIGTFGTSALAANQIVFASTTLIFMWPEGIREAAAIRVAHLVGLGFGRKSSVSQVGTAAIMATVLYLVPFSIVMWTAPNLISALFLDLDAPGNRDAVSLAAVLMAIAGFNQLVDGIQVSMLGSLKGLRDTRGPLLIGLVGYWVVGLPLGYLLAFPLNLGPAGLWVGLLMGIGVASALLVFRFFRLASAMMRSHGAHLSGSSVDIAS